MFRPKSVNIMGNRYSIRYVKSQIDVDRSREKHLYGQINYMSSSIRIFDNGQIGEAEVMSTIFEEVLHGIQEDLRITISHNDLSRVSKALADLFIRNRWIKEK